VRSVAARYLNNLLWLFRNRAATERTPLQLSGLLNKYKFFILFFAIFNINMLYAADTLSEKNEQLKGVNSQIVVLKKNLQMTEKQRSELLRTLKQTDNQIAKTNAELKVLNQKTLNKQALLESSKKETAVLEKNLNTQKKLLAQQLRASYQMGEYEYFQLLLNQQDPGTMLRLMTYSQYIHEARVKTLLDIHKTEKEIQKKQQTIEKEMKSLQTLLQKNQENKMVFQKNQQKRQQILKQLNQKIQVQASKLKEYEANKKQLEALVKRLKKISIPAISKPQPIKPVRSSSKPSSSGIHSPSASMANYASGSFGKNAHHFIWPTSGTLLNKASVPALKNELGIIILAPAGQHVVAVYPGKIVFSDWLKGYGLLIIIDHGNGFMTLYAYNQTLYQKRGTFVKAGDIVADVGHTGILSQNGLYFEVRKNGKALNPLQWLSSGDRK
jgi:septal ring factor EnvC (AmiA/AmiB activator)